MKKIILYTTLLLGATLGYGQSSLFHLTYDTGLPIAEAADYTANFSGRGMTFNGRAFINENVAIGGSWSWQVFREKTDEVLRFPDGDTEFDVSGVQVRYINALPFLATFHYYSGFDGDTRPYVGLGIGAYRMLQRLEIGTIGLENNTWNFGFAPEVGVYIPMGLGNTGANLGIRYNYALSASDSPTYQYLNFFVGFGFAN